MPQIPAARQLERTFCYWPTWHHLKTPGKAAALPQTPVAEYFQATIGEASRCFCFQKSIRRQWKVMKTNGMACQARSEKPGPGINPESRRTATPIMACRSVRAWTSTPRLSVIPKAPFVSKGTMDGPFQEARPSQEKNRNKVSSKASLTSKMFSS